MPSSRRYSDEEVHAIFERAAARQEEAKSAEEASRAGLSVEELQQIGAEAGIDPAHVALAASELEGQKHTKGTQQTEAFLGIPTRISDSRRIRGQVGDEEWERIVHELRDIFGRDGIAGEIGKVREWTVSPGIGKSDRPVKVTVKPEGDETTVIVNQELKGQAMGFSIAAGVYLGMALVMMLVDTFTGGDGPPIGVSLMFVGLAALFWGGAQVGTRIHAKRQRAKFERTLDRIELIARDVPNRIAEDVTSPAIDLDSLPDTVEDMTTTPHATERERE